MGKGARGFLLACSLAAVAWAVIACPKQVTGCMSNSDCDAGFACQSQLCISVTCDGGCDAGYSCVNALCVSPNCPTGPCAAGLVCDLSCLSGIDASVCSGACVSPSCIN